MLSCNEMMRLGASGELEEASWGTRFRVTMHLAMCRHCRRYARQLRMIADAARRIAADRVVRPEFEERVIAVVREG